jgi:hypothetical protein
MSGVEDFPRDRQYLSRSLGRVGAPLAAHPEHARREIQCQRSIETSDGDR